MATTTTPPEILASTKHADHRLDFERFVLEQAEPWHREHLGALYAAWRDYNRTHFASAMTPPYILLAEPITPQTYGDTSWSSGFGSRMQIRIRPSLVRGTHPMMADGSNDPDGRQRFVLDVLLHETIHHYQYELLDTHEASYDGHGPTFRDTANRIGALLGLPPVRASKAPKKVREALPSCAHWPHNVRPAGYYLGVLKRRRSPFLTAEDDLFATLTRLTKDTDLAMLERVCARLLASKKRQRD